jgi:arabinan endo-1,5-alpha-L-arabinosidase
MKYNLLASVLAAATTVSGYANPMPCTGTCEGRSHDPSMIKHGNTYWRYATGEKIVMHSAPSLTGPWKFEGAALPQGSKLRPAVGWDDLWAPDVTKVGDTYYMYYTVSQFQTQNSQLGLATSKDARKWTDHGAIGVSSQQGKNNYNAIDANLYWDGSKFLMNYGSFWNGLFQMGMNNPPTKASGGARNLEFQPAGTHATEGAFMTISGNYHYLFWSEGVCCNFPVSKPAKGKEYKIMVARSKSASGPFVDKAGRQATQGGGEVVLQSHGFVYGPGGQGVFWDPDQGPILYYHYVDTRVGYADFQKKFGMNKINFSSGWPVV